MSTSETLSVRPYQVLCTICAFGENEDGPREGRLKEVLDAVRACPDRPMSLRCNAGDVYVYQDPGPGEDTPEGADYNRKRDLDILARLDLAPGALLPARTVFQSALHAIPSPLGVCGYATTTGDAWRGCAKTCSGFYERGRERGIAAIIPPRSEAEMAHDKEASLRDMLAADAIPVRPHILVCAVAQYGNGVRPPYPPDNLPEMLQHILKHPETPIALVGGADWTMCGSCPSRVPAMNACVCGQIGSGGLYNELKDLNLLQALGLTYGTTMPARDIYALIFERVTDVAGVCALTNGLPDTSVWRDGCGKSDTPCPGYAKGRELLLDELGLRQR